MNQWDDHADLIDDRIGSGGDDLHIKLIDPLILSYLGDVFGKTVLDLGCGNGYLFHKLSGVASYTGIDSSPKLLERARQRIPSGTFIQTDISQPLGQPKVDVVVCNMVLQYVPVLDGVVFNVARLLKPEGVFVMIIDHPSHALFVRAQQLVGKNSDKFLDLASYFQEGKRAKKSLWDKAVLTYYHRTLASYVNAFSQSLHLDRMDEVSEDGEMPRILGLKFIKEDHAKSG